MVDRLALRVASMVTASMSGCESEHSWAWIDPSGKLIDVPDHGDWARENFPEETYQYAIDNFKPQDWPRISNRKVLFHFLKLSCYDPYQFAEKPPADLLQRGTVYTIPDSARIEAERLSLPTLSMGSWALRTKLNRAEEKFLAYRGLSPELVSVTPDNYWNRKIKRLWDDNASLIMSRTRDYARLVLMQSGWVTVANAYSLGAQREPSSVQWESFFRSVLACWKAAGLRPPVDREVLHLSVADTTYKTLRYDEAIDLYCPRRLQDEIYEYLLEGKSTMLREERAEIERLENLAQYGGAVYPTPAPADKIVSGVPAKAPFKRKERYPYRPRM